MNTRSASRATMTVRYLPRGGGELYEFEFCWLNGWRIYIVNQPSYRGLPQDGVTTHRLTENGRHFICWTTRIATLDDAKVVAASWAEGTERYRRTGNPQTAFAHPLYNTFREDRAAQAAFRRLSTEQT